MPIGGVYAVDDDTLKMLFAIWWIVLFYIKNYYAKRFNGFVVSMTPENCVTMLKCQHSPARLKVTRLRSCILAMTLRCESCSCVIMS